MNVDMINMVNSLNLNNQKPSLKDITSKDKFTKVIEKEGQKSSDNKPKDKLQETNKEEDNSKEKVNVAGSKEKLDLNNDEKEVIYFINPNLILKNNLNLEIENELNLEFELETNLEELGINLENQVSLLEDTNTHNKNILNLMDLESVNLDNTISKDNLGIKELILDSTVKQDMTEDNSNLLETVDSTKRNTNVDEIKASLADSELKSRLNLNSANRVITKKTDSEVELKPIAVSVDAEISNEEVEMSNLNNNQDEEAPADDNFDNLNLEFKDVISSKTVVKQDKVAVSTNFDKFKLENLDEINTEMIQLIETTNDGQINSMKVQLYPKDLGTVDISVTLENGQLKAKILVENENVKTLFTKSLDELNQSLLKQNIEVKEFTVDVNTGFNEKNQNEQDQNKKRNTFVKEFTLSNEEELVSIRSVMENNTDLNILA